MTTEISSSDLMSQHHVVGGSGEGVLGGSATKAGTLDDDGSPKGLYINWPSEVV